MPKIFENTIKEDEILPVGLKGLTQNAQDIDYSSGSSVEDLEPAEVDADKTSGNTAANITGQGDLAIKDNVDLATGEVTNKTANNLNYVAGGAPTVESLKPAAVSADVTSANTSNDTTNVNSVLSTQIQPTAENLNKNRLFIGNYNDGLTETLGGSAIITRGLLSTLIDVDSGESAKLHSTTLGTLFTFGKDYEFVINFIVGSGTAKNVFFGITGGVTTFPADGVLTASEHIGFIIDDTTLYSSNCDQAGGTQTKTDITSGITLTNWNTYRFVFDTGTDIKFYVNDVLEATHTTNLPSGAPSPIIFIGMNHASVNGQVIHTSNNYTIFGII